MKKHIEIRRIATLKPHPNYRLFAEIRNELDESEELRHAEPDRSRLL
jgi:hypothetical protein